MTLGVSIDWETLLAHPDVQALCALALCEDLGAGDVTTEAIFTEPQRVRAHMAARQPTVVCGLPLVRHLLRSAPLGADVAFARQAAEGAEVAAGGVLLQIEADVRLLLALERTVLNFAMRLCGIAAGTRQAVRSLPPGARTQVLDTRKTTPGWRRLDKAAVRTGGGHNHRMGLYDAVLIKDNHIAAAGSVRAAVERARAKVGHRLTVEVEVDTLEQLGEALAAAPDVILLDNFNDAALREAVRRVAGRVPLEASGGISLKTLAAVAATGVDRVSMGSLTHSAVPAELGLDVLS